MNKNSISKRCGEAETEILHRWPSGGRKRKYSLLSTFKKRRTVVERQIPAAGVNASVGDNVNIADIGVANSRGTAAEPAVLRNPREVPTNCGCGFGIGIGVANNSYKKAVRNNKRWTPQFGSGLSGHGGKASGNGGAGEVAAGAGSDNEGGAP